MWADGVSDIYTETGSERHKRQREKEGLKSNPWKASDQSSVVRSWMISWALCVCLSESWFVCVCQRGVKSSPPSAQLDRNSEASTPGLQLFGPNALASHTHSILSSHDLYRIYTGCLMLRINTGQMSFTESLLLNVWLLTAGHKPRALFCYVCLSIRECLDLCIHWFFWWKS